MSDAKLVVDDWDGSSPLVVGELPTKPCPEGGYVIQVGRSCGGCGGRTLLHRRVPVERGDRVVVEDTTDCPECGDPLANGLQQVTQRGRSYPGWVVPLSRGCGTNPGPDLVPCRECGGDPFANYPAGIGGSGRVSRRRTATITEIEHVSDDDRGFGGCPFVLSLQVEEEEQ